MELALLLVTFVVTLALGVPVAICLALASLAYMLAAGLPIVILPQRMYAGMDVFVLLCIPGFILAGNLMNIAGVTGRIYHFALSLVGWMKGGLAQVNIIGSVIFSGMSGTALADAAGILHTNPKLVWIPDDPRLGQYRDEFRNTLATLEEDARDAKTALQEWAQAQGMPPPRYEVMDRSGPDHAPHFRIRAVLDDGRAAEASGSGSSSSKTSAVEDSPSAARCRGADCSALSRLYAAPARSSAASCIAATWVCWSASKAARPSAASSDRAIASNAFCMAFSSSADAATGACFCKTFFAFAAAFGAPSSISSISLSAMLSSACASQSSCTIPMRCASSAEKRSPESRYRRSAR